MKSNQEREGALGREEGRLGSACGRSYHGRKAVDFFELPPGLRARATGMGSRKLVVLGMSFVSGQPSSPLAQHQPISHGPDVRQTSHGTFREPGLAVRGAAAVEPAVDTVALLTARSQAPPDWLCGVAVPVLFARPPPTRENCC